MRHYSRRLAGAAALPPAAAILLTAALWGIPGAQPARADQGAEGIWLTEGGRGKVRIAPCGEFPGLRGASDDLCGAIVWLQEPDNAAGQPKTDRNNPEPALQDRPIVGLPILAGFKPAAEPGRWEGGRIYNPEDGETYKSTLALRNGGAQLEVRGYVGLPIFGKSQVWTRGE